jgi:hypothetical protein
MCMYVLGGVCVCMNVYEGGGEGGYVGVEWRYDRVGGIGSARTRGMGGYWHGRVGGHMAHDIVGVDRAGGITIEWGQDGRRDCS